MPTVSLQSKPKPQKAVDKPFRGFTIDDNTDARLNALAGKYKLSRSEVVRQLVNQVYESEFGKGG